MVRFMKPVLCAALFATPALGAQSAPPNTDVYLVRLRGAGGSTISDPPENLTHRPGYDNQPAFTADGKAILFTSIHADGQADTYRIDLATHAVTQVTHTPESEYSPTPLPTGTGFSVVRVEMDSAQRLWAFNAAGNAPVLLLPNVAPVGYHVWTDDHTVALFVLGNPNTLQIADTQTGEARTIARDIGQSLQRVPGSSKFSFIQKAKPADILEIADPSAADGAIEKVLPLPPRAGYVAWESPTAVLTAVGTTVYRLDLSIGAKAVWTPIADFAEEGMKNLTRLAVSPDGMWLAVVAEPTKN